jgi:hypothetical protein
MRKLTAILGRRGSIPKGVSAAHPHASGGPSSAMPSRSAAASRILAPEEKGTCLG